MIDAPWIRALLEAAALLVSAEALFTNSAARFLSGYLSVGAVSQNLDSGRAWTSPQRGIKARFTASGYLRILTLGYQFGAGVW